MNKKFFASIVSFALFSLPVIASAHVTVKPAQVGVGSYQLFSISVPSEKESSTVGLRLFIPEGLESVTPTVKPGWQIISKKSADGKITEVRWASITGYVPQDMRDDFTFSAKVPAQETKLIWKAEQSYANGEGVAWTLDPAAEQPKDHDGKNDFSKSGPYSVTAVVDDLKGEEKKDFSPAFSAVAVVIGIISLTLSAIALRRTSRN